MSNLMKRLVVLRLAAAVLCSSLPLQAQTAATPPQQQQPSPEPVKVDSDTISGLDARSIGPAAMGGRVSALAAAWEGERLTVYVGSASGGVWKSANGGTTFKPVFDRHTQSIGAVAVDPQNPKTIWVGTGESWVRNSVSVGDGVYRSTDGGETWAHLGLKDSERIASVVVDAKDSNTAYVCATGHLWDSNPERGVFKTTDAGKTWQKVLTVNDDTGCAMLDADPQDPKTLYAAMWQFRRRPWSFTSGGPGSGLFKTTDGGKNWTRLTKGLPEGELGRIGVRVAPSNPKRVYAVAEAKRSALFRSDDAGATWAEVNNGANVVGRPFYFANLYVDPKEEKRVYKPGTSLSISEDAGKTFSPVAGSVHSDFHAMWIDPKNPERMFVGTDGGLYSSEDRGARWRFHANLPISQFYHVSYDMNRPYNVYGGLQDNASWYGPSSAVGGVQNKHWRSVFGGDGFWVFEDPSDPDYVYAEYQGGNLARVNRRTLETRDIKPLPRAGEEFRFNWNAPVHTSPTQKGTIYFGAQFLFRSRDRGDSWERISPDLTTNDPAKQKQEESGGLTIDNSSAENHTTIYTISESPKNAQVVWAGTDDGNLQVTRDGGRTWANVVKNVPRLPPNTWVSYVTASNFDAATAYATFDGHMNGDMKTYVYRTSDFGKTWAPLASADTEGYAHVVKEDTVKKDLLFLGTEFGLYVSLDGGRQWARFRGGDFPRVAVRDLSVHPRDNDLLVATHGRGVWIVDDITPLRALTPEVLAADADFVQSAPPVQAIPGGEFGFGGDAEFVGRAESDNAQIVYYQRKRHIFGDLKFEIYDAAGKLVSTIPGNKRRGLNRIEWSMRAKGPKVPPAAGLVQNFYALVGPRVPEGTYTVKMIKDKATYETKIQLVADPRSRHTKEERALQFATVNRLYGMLGDLTFTVDSLADLRAQTDDRLSKLGATDPARGPVESLLKSLDALRARIVSTRDADGGITGEERIREKMGQLYGAINAYDGRPSRSQIERIDELGKELAAAVADFDKLAGTALPAANAALAEKQLPPLKLMTRQEWDAKQQAGN
jgi:photosystem II stability/assembly factor-like uncharacterized protein